MTPRERQFHAQNERYLNELIWSDSEQIPPGWKAGVKAHLLKFYEPVQYMIWSEPDEKGLVRIAGYRPVHEVLAEVNARIKADGIEFDETDFSSMLRYSESAIGDPAPHPRGAETWPAVRRLFVFPVTGGSEGHYVHIAGIAEDPPAERKHVTIALCKTFQGWDHAVRIAEAAGRHLGV